MAQHGRTVKQSYCETVYVMILFNYSSRVPIPHWLCFLHVHCCRDCETVTEQHWNTPGTVSQSQCTPPQCKQIIFGIKNGSEVQGQSSSELTEFLTVLKCICGPNLEILSWTGDELSHGQAQNRVNFDFEVKFDLEVQGQSPPKTIRDLNQGLLHLWCKFGDPSLNWCWVIARTSKWLPHGRTDTQTDAGNDNTRRPKLASGKNTTAVYFSCGKYCIYVIM